MIGLPRALQQLLLGQPAAVHRPQRPLPTFTYDPALLRAAQADPRERHDYTAGEFVVDEEPPRDPAITLTAIDPVAAAALAEELKALTVGGARAATAAPGDPAPTGDHARFAAPHADARS